MTTKNLYDNIAERYDELFPLKDVRKSFIRGFLHDDPLAVLDIGCATGELALELGRGGHRVTGIDLNAPMVRAAQEKARAQKLGVEFHVLDMTKVGSPGAFGSRNPAFDAVFCLGNTLVHLDGLPVIGRFFSSVRNVLKATGVFLLQVVNYDRILSENVKGLPLLETPNFQFQRQYDYDKTRRRTRFLTTLTAKDTGAIIEENETILYPITRDELESGLKDAGFSSLQFFGTESPTPWTPQSPATIVCGKVS